MNHLGPEVVQNYAYIIYKFYILYMHNFALPLVPSGSDKESPTVTILYLNLQHSYYACLHNY